MTDEIPFYEGVGQNQPPAQAQNQAPPPQTVAPQEMPFGQGVQPPGDNTIVGALGRLVRPDTAALERGLNEQAADRTGNLYASQMMKGVPVIGHDVPWLEKNIVPENARITPERTAAFEQESPLLSTGLQTAGSLASTVPAFAAAPGLAGSMGVGAALSAADTMEGGGDMDAVLKSGLYGAAGSAFAHVLGNPSVLGRQAGRVLSQGIPRWEQLPTAARNVIGQIVTIGGLGHAIYNMSQHGVGHVFDLAEAAAALGMGAGAATGAGGHGWYSHLIPDIWNGLIMTPNTALKAAQSTPMAHALVKSGMNQITRKMNEPEPQKIGGKVRPKKHGDTSGPMKRAIRHAHVARAS